MDYNWDLSSSRGQQDFAAWVDRTIKNEVNSYSRQVLGISNTGSGSSLSSSLTATSSPNNTIIPSGTIVPYAGINPPDGWVFCNAQTLDRTVYSTLFNVISIPFINATVDGTTTIKNLTGVNTTEWLGWGIAGNGISSGAIISSATSTTIVISGTTTNVGSSNIVISPYGFTGANNITTFNVPDLRGRMPAGRDTMNSSLGAANRITTTSIPTYGGNNLGRSGGDQIMSHIHYGYGQGGNLSAAIGATNSNIAAIGYQAGSPIGPGPSTSTYTITGGIGGVQTFNHYTPVYGVTSDASNYNNLQPTLITNYIIKT